VLPRPAAGRRLAPGAGLLRRRRRARPADPVQLRAGGRGGRRLPRGTRRGAVRHPRRRRPRRRPRSDRAGAALPGAPADHRRAVPRRELVAPRSPGVATPGLDHPNEALTVWTPKRVLLLASGFVLFFAAYAGYARVLGGIDGLPALPDQYLPPVPGTGR